MVNAIHVLHLHEQGLGRAVSSHADPGAQWLGFWSVRMKLSFTIIRYSVLVYCIVKGILHCIEILIPFLPLSSDVLFFFFPVQ